MSDQPSLPQPGPEHARLTANVGIWDVACTFHMGPEPVHNAAVETVEAIGGYWTVSLFEADLFGQPFRGRATVGYEPHSGQWVSTWVDSMAPHLFHFRGGYDAAGKVLTMTGDGPEPMTGKLTTYRTVETHISDDERHFDMYVKTGDGEQQLAHYVYTRRR